MPRTLATVYGNGERPQKDEFYTPLWLIQALGEFDLDPACGKLCPNRTAKRRYQVRGLERPWSGRVWLNPPFSNTKPWIEKMAKHGRGTALVMLSGSKWFEAAVKSAGGMFLVPLKQAWFKRPDGSKSCSPMPIVLLPFGPRDKQKLRNSPLRGTWLEVA